MNQVNISEKAKEGLALLMTDDEQSPPRFLRKGIIYGIRMEFSQLSAIFSLTNTKEYKIIEAAESHPNLDVISRTGPLCVEYAHIGEIIDDMSLFSFSSNSLERLLKKINSLQKPLVEKLNRIGFTSVDYGNMDTKLRTYFLSK
jgi:hypothetical protein